MTKLKLGTNGWVYANSNRKGLDLWTKLVNDPELKQLFDFKASGRGWGNMTTAYPYPYLEQFYHDIDVYVSTSSIEGIGYGVLEALACGLPVVIPYGVGIYDEIPITYGIYRYNINDYEDLKFTLQLISKDVKENKINPYTLRSATERFNIDNYVNSHVSAFEDLLYNHNTPKSQKNGDSSDLTGKQGIYYVAYGENARNCFKLALTSVRKYLGDIPVCLVSDTPVDIDLDYQFIEYPDNDIGARNNKTMIYELAPKEWEYILYLDSDTQITSKDSLVIFDFLRDGFDFIICVNPEKYGLVSDMIRPDNKEELDDLIDKLGTGNLVCPNGGVFAFRRNENTQNLLNNWNKEWKIYGARDQAALLRVLYNEPVKIYMLGVEFNTIDRYYPNERSAGIIHSPMTARRWKGRISGRLDSSEAWGAIHPKE